MVSDLTSRATTPTTASPRPRLHRSLFTGLSHGGGFWFVASLGAANVGNFAFHAIASNRMGPANYGALGTLLAITLAISLPAAALQVATTKAAAQGREFTTSTRELLGRVTGIVAICATFIGLISPLLSTFLHLDSIAPILWMAAFLIPAFAGSVSRGLLLAENRLGALAVAILLSTSIKVGAGLLVLNQGTQLSSATALLFFTEFSLMLGLGWATRSSFGSGLQLQVRWRDICSSAGAFWGMWAMLAIDLAAARHFLSPESTGVYVAAATVARGVLFIPQSMALVAHAKMVTSSREQARAILRGTLTATLAIAIFVIVFATVAGGPLVTRVFGDQFRLGFMLIALLATSSGLLAVTNLLVLYRLSQDHSTNQVWIGPISISLIAWAAHASPIQIAFGALAGALLSLIAVLPRKTKPEIGPTHAARITGASDFDVSVIVAAYESEPVAVARIQEVLEVMDRTTKTYEVLVIDEAVSDDKGSQTLTLKDIVHQAVTLLKPGAPAAWGSSLCLGIAEARGRQIVLLDAANDLSPKHIPTFLELLRFYDADAVVGSKRHPKSSVHYPLPRRAASRAYQLLVLALFRLSVRDPQVGIKAFTRESLADALPYLDANSAAFDIELLAVCNRTKHRRIVEAPVEIKKSFSRSLSVFAVGKIVLETFAIHGRVRRIQPAKTSYPTTQQIRSPRTQTTKAAETIDLRTLPAT